MFNLMGNCVLVKDAKGTIPVRIDASVLSLIKLNKKNNIYQKGC
jgi:hypothetical protein